MGKANIRFLADKRLYSRTEECLQFLRKLGPGSDKPSLPIPQRFHVYWYGPISAKQTFTIKSFLATQDLKRSELWLWLDNESGYAGYKKNPQLLPYLPYLHVRRFDPEAEARNTPLERRPELYRNVSLSARSDFFRFVALYKYGGIYIDMDIMFLRDMSRLIRNFHSEFCYQWSSQPFANSAVLKLRQHSKNAQKLLTRCIRVKSCHPRKVLRLDYNIDLDLLVLPCPFFDPLWPHHDREDKYKAAPFQRFEDFFRKFDKKFQRKPTIHSYRDFFPGAFAYHWHNVWDAHEHKNSYFGFFDQEFDSILRKKLGI
ncbi:glycosyltransferase [Ammoniphilus sp. 3BR4]|uniref:glycosyltransferase n=1 Tax=Ammoniphilus sp. 3BR4 TaxID=3158265 RepID=UPI003465C427